MGGRWGFILGVACGLFLGLTGGGATEALPSNSPELAELLPHAVLLWKSAVLAPEAGPPGWFLLGTGDIDGDGYVDAIFAQPDSARVLRGGGDGRFKDVWPIFYERKPAPGGGFYAAGTFTAQSGTLADLDGDGNLDLLASGFFSDQSASRLLSKLFVFHNEGRFFFERVGAYDLPSPFCHLWVGDLNSDGFQDVVGAVFVEDKVGYHYKIYVLTGRGLALGEPNLVADLPGKPVALIDVDGDGFLDLVWFEKQTVKFLFGDGKGGFAQAGYEISVPEDVRDVALGDANGDGFLDLVVAAPPSLLVVHQNPGLSFTVADSISLHFSPESVRLADFTGDGLPDIVAKGGQRVQVLPNNGRGSFSPKGSEYLLETTGTLHTVDVNADGKADLLLEGRFYTIVLMNDGEPWGASHLFFEGSLVLGVRDVSGDGYPEVFVQRAEGVDVFWNNGRGAFIRAKLADLPFLPVTACPLREAIYVLGVSVERTYIGWPPQFVERTVGHLVRLSWEGQTIQEWKHLENVIPILAAGDFDGDGTEDLICPAEDALLVLWKGKELVRYPWPNGRLSLITAGDFDGDGMKELAAVTTDGESSLLFLSLKGRELKVGEPLLHFGEVLPLALGAGDLDGDGRSDPLAIGLKFAFDLVGEQLRVEPAGAQLVMHLSSAGTRIMPLPDFPAKDAPLPLQGLAVGDLNGDGAADLVYTTAAGAGCFVLFGKGAGSFAEPWRIPVPVGPLWTGDLDGNGKDEVIAPTLGMSPSLWILWNGGGR